MLAAAPTTTTPPDQSKVEALALSIGSRITVSTVFLAAVLVIVIGANSMAGALASMDRDIKEMNEQLAIANGGLVVLNKTMDSLPPTAGSLSNVVETVKATKSEVDTSAKSINNLASTTESLNGRIDGIAGSTASMRSSLQDVAGGTGELRQSVVVLNDKVDPLVTTQHTMLLETRKMQGGIDGMNDSLAYVIRILNYLAVPPTGQGFTLRGDLPKETLPPIPFIRAETEPIVAFPRNPAGIYRGP